MGRAETFDTLCYQITGSHLFQGSDGGDWELGGGDLVGMEDGLVSWVFGLLGWVWPSLGGRWYRVWGYGIVEILSGEIWVVGVVYGLVEVWPAEAGVWSNRG